MIRNTLLLLILLFFFQSCEDKKSAKEKPASPEEIQTRIDEDQTSDTTNFSKAKKQQNIKMTDTVDGQLLVQTEVIPFLTEYGKTHPQKKIRITTKFGNIDVLLFEETPLHRANFIMLANEDYFNDTYFYRVVENFVIQGGDSDNLSTSKKRNKIGNYLIPNEYTNKYKNVRGAFAAAKHAEQNVSNASSPYDFYIVQSPNDAHHLDGEHTVFGKVIAGMDVVDEIAKQEIGEGEWPLINIPIQVEILD